VVVREDAAGRNSCAAYHPEAYLRHNFSPILPVAQIIPDGQRDADQDSVVLVRPS
jgi:hypothetical protein